MVYADNAATTKMSPAAIKAMLPYMETIWGNPSSLYGAGQRAAEALQSARERIAACFGASAGEIYFTSGGSEADNQAIISAAKIGERKGKKHIISSAFEHHAVLHTLKKLEKAGFEIELLDVHENGLIHPSQVADAIREDTLFKHASNHEIDSTARARYLNSLSRYNGKKAMKLMKDRNLSSAEHM